MTSSLPLGQQAEAFAERMTTLVRSTFTEDADIRAVHLDLPVDTFLVGNRIPPSPSTTAETVRTLRGKRMPTGVPFVEIAANWRFVPSSTGEWLKTDWSGFALWVDDSPFIRLEVDPNKGGHDVWLAAHIQVTGESHFLGYLLGLQGKKRRRLSSLHLPVGGFRYRPCLEDFIEFAIDEGLIPGNDGWQQVLNDTREEYRRAQLWSLVQKYPDIARSALGIDTNDHDS